MTRLLDAVDEVVFAAGAADAPVDVILERARVSPATLYRAFDSKDGLLAAALDRRHAEWIEVWDLAISRESTDRERLLAVFDALDDFQSRATGARWCAFLGTTAAHVEPEPVLAAAVRQDSESMRSRLHELAVPLVGDDAPVLVEALVLLCSGRLAMRLRPSTRSTPRPPARELAELLLDHPGHLGP